METVAQDIPLNILYEDDDVLIVNKPKGMVVHPAPGHEDNTLVNAIMYHCGDSLSGINGEKRPGIVHRIDRDTTGSLIVCKNDKAHNAIAAQIKEHTVNRIYEGIVIGNIKDDDGTIDAPIARSKADRKKMAIDPAGRRAVTHYHVLERFGSYTCCEFKLETGRTHQIRVHMAPSVIRSWEILSTDQKNAHSSSRDRHCMQRRSDSSILQPANMWSFQRRSRNTLKTCWQSLEKPVLKAEIPLDAIHRLS